MSRQYRLRIVSVLDLSEDAQQLIDNYNLAEATIRPIVEKLKKYPDLQVQALRQLIAWQAAEESGEGEGRRIVPSVRSLVNKLLAAKRNTNNQSVRSRPAWTLASSARGYGVRYVICRIWMIKRGQSLHTSLRITKPTPTSSRSYKPCGTR